MRTWIGMAAVLLMAQISAGCSSTEYRGAQPSARWFTGTPAPRDYYLGMDFSFAVDREPGYHRFDSPTLVAARPSPEASRAEMSTAPVAGN